MSRTPWLLLLAACKGADTDDTDVDTDVPIAPWAWCPDEAAYVGPGGDAALVSEGVAWCALSNEGVELADEPARKAQLLVVAGRYALPHTAVTDADFALPACLRFPDDAHPDPAGAGALASTITPYGDVVAWSWTGRQPFTRGSVAYGLESRLYVEQAAGAPAPSATMGGSAGSAWDGPQLSFTLVQGPEGAPTAWWGFVPCAYADPPRVETTRISFDGGEVNLVLHIGESMASTEPAMFVHADGTLDGVAFAQDDYWKLVYNPEHHHFSRHFAVVFDAPIGGACGLAAREVDAYYDGTTGTPAILERVDCALAAIETRAVTAQVTERATGG